MDHGPVPGESGQGFSIEERSQRLVPGTGESPVYPGSSAVRHDREHQNPGAGCAASRYTVHEGMKGDEDGELESLGKVDRCY